MSRGSVDKTGVESQVGGATVKRGGVDARFASAFQTVGSRRDDVPNPRGDQPTPVEVLLIASGFHLAVPPNARIVTEKPESRNALIEEERKLRFNSRMRVQRRE